MLEIEKFKFCSEFYTIEKSIEVVINHRIFRLDAMKNEHTKKYSVNAYEYESFTLQLSHTKTQPNNYNLLCRYDLSSFIEDSADDALRTALFFLNTKIMS